MNPCGWPKGRKRGPMSAERRAAISARMTGKKLSAEHRAKLVAYQISLLPVPPKLADDYRLYRKKKFAPHEALAALGLAP